jgi:hypothetical protein
MMNNNMSNMPQTMNAGMNVAGPSPAMMNPQMMMEMSNMMMNMGNMDMAQMMQHMQQQAQDGGGGGGPGGGGMGMGGMGVGGANEQVQPGGMMMQDGPYPTGPASMMNMGMGAGGDFGMQVRWT